MNSLQFASRYRKIPWRRRAAGEENRVEFTLQFFNGHVHTDVRVGAEHHAFLVHDVQPPVENVLFHLEFGNAVPQKATDAVCPLEHGDPVSCLIQLSRSSKAGRSRTHYRDSFAGPDFRASRPDESFVESPVDDGDFDVLDGYWIRIDPQHARTLAGCWADPPSEFGKVVGCEQAVQRLLPLTTV